MNQSPSINNSTTNPAPSTNTAKHQTRPDNQRVVVTGMGAVTPLGQDVESTWQSMLNGDSGIQRIEHFDVSDYRCQITGLVKEFDASRYMPAKDARRYDTFMHYAIASSAMALLDAGYISQIEPTNSPLAQVNPNRCGVVFGSGIGGIQTIENNINTLTSKGAKRVSPFVIPGSIINMPAGLLAIKYGLKGANLATATACATSTHAIGLAARLIAYGDADMIVAGGSEHASSPLGMSGFAAMQALSTRNDAPQQASRPFDKDRDGFVLADGSGTLILESLAHAKQRGATILAELAGFGMSDDAHHITAPSQQGEGAARAMQAALLDAGVDAPAVGYINAHGTSTPAGDIAESQAIAHVFAGAVNLSVSSTKSMTGHMLGAAGAVEAIATIKALQTGHLPPNLNLKQLDDACQTAGIDYITDATQVQNIHYAMSNSFGFGGTNGSLLFCRYLND